LQLVGLPLDRNHPRKAAPLFMAAEAKKRADHQGAVALAGMAMARR
jgi:hypothetical protein